MRQHDERYRLGHGNDSRDAEKGLSEISREYMKEMRAAKEALKPRQPQQDASEPPKPRGPQQG